MILRTLVITICMTISLQAISKNPTIPPTEKATTSTLAKLFISDYDNSMLFIDFAVMNSQFTTLSISQNNELVMEEDVSDLLPSTIYEVNFDQLEKSITYVLKLETADGITINKEFVIN